MVGPGALFVSQYRTAHGRKRSLGQSQDLPYGILIQLPAETVTAALAAESLDQFLLY